MSIISDVLATLKGFSGRAAQLRHRMVGETRVKGDHTIADTTLRVTLSRLKKQGFVEETEGVWSITQRGKHNLQKRIVRKPSQHVRHRADASSRKRDMIIAFDVPEELRAKRDWLRDELVALGFVPLQKSVWFGSSPLPEEFIQSLDELGVMKFIRFFKAAEEDVI